MLSKLLKGKLPSRRRDQQPPSPDSKESSNATTVDSQPDSLPEHILQNDLTHIIADDMSSIHVGSVNSAISDGDQHDKLCAPIMPKTQMEILHEAEEELKPSKCQAISEDKEETPSSEVGSMVSSDIFSFVEDVHEVGVDISLSADSGAADVTAGNKEGSSQGQDDDIMLNDMSIFFLSLLSDRDSESLEIATEAERIAECSLRRHLEVYIDTKTQGDEYQTYTERQISRAIQEEPSQIDRWVYDLLRQNKVDYAIHMYRRLLDEQRSEKSPDVTASAVTMSKLSILCLKAGDLKFALGYAKNSLRLNREESRQSAVVVSLMTLGMVYFRGNQIKKAVSNWREAIQLSCLVHGYDHQNTAVLLNNVACAQYCDGNLAQSLRTLSESLDLHQSLLFSSCKQNQSLLGTSIVKGNIGMLAARTKDYSTSIRILEEVLSLQETALGVKRHSLLETTLSNIEKIRRTSALEILDEQPTLFDMFSGIEENSSLQIENVQVAAFGDANGIPMRMAGVLDRSDVLDTLRIGSCDPDSPHSPRQRVRDCTLTWFGKEPGIHTVQRRPFDDSPRGRTKLLVDLDHQDVVDADLHLEGIHSQVVEHLEVRLLLLEYM